MNPSLEFDAKLKACDPDIQEYMAAFQTENAKLQKRIIKLEVQKISDQNKIAALESDLSNSVEAFHSKNKVDKLQHADFNALLAGLPTSELTEESEQTRPANPRPSGTSVMSPAASGWQIQDKGKNDLPVSPSLGTRAGATPEASGDS